MRHNENDTTNTNTASGDEHVEQQVGVTLVNGRWVFGGQR